MNRNHKLIFLIVFVNVLFFSANFAFGENFIRQIHTICIPKVAGAYNASIIEFEEGFLMAFRYDKYKLPIYSNLNEFYQHIGLIQLDQQFHPIYPWTLCKEVGNRAYDPRLIKVGDSIYLIYTSARPSDAHSSLSSQLCFTKVHPLGRGFKVDFPKPLQKEGQQNWEKNWVPFNYENELMLAYTINPHEIIRPSLEDGLCTHLFKTEPPITWNFGLIRGGTPAILIDNEYLAFFHSSQRNPENGRYTYYIGAYTFESTPPFSLTRISYKPFSHPDFYTTPETPLSTSLVLFPAGLAIKDNLIFVSYGENDGAIKVMEIDKQLLDESLRPVEIAVKTLEVKTGLPLEFSSTETETYTPEKD